MSKFNEYFCLVNGLTKTDFKEWLLCSGMLFSATGKWWGDHAKRQRSHEGVDLGFYRDPEGRVTAVDHNTEIPLLYNGVIVGIFDDFLGKSLFVIHDIKDRDNRSLCSVYGHVEPDKNIFQGKTVPEGESIARIANADSSTINPHLHITIGWLLKQFSDELLDWKNVGDPNMIKLIDPLTIISQYALVPDSVLF